jgi:large subunit ribosomal protein L10
MLDESKIAIVAGYQGMTVAEMTELRSRLREVDAEFHVVKNTLANLAMDNVGIDHDEALWQEANGIGLTTGDPAAATKIIVEQAKQDERLVLKAGFLDKAQISPEQIQALADLPSREVLLAQAFAGMQAPIAGFVRVMGGLLQGLVNVLDARSRQLQEEAAG